MHQEHCPYHVFGLPTFFVLVYITVFRYHTYQHHQYYTHPVARSSNLRVRALAPSGWLKQLA